MVKIWQGKSELFAKIFLADIHRHTENALAYALTVAYSPFPPPKFLVYGNYIINQVHITSSYISSWLCTSSTVV